MHTDRQAPDSAGDHRGDSRLVPPYVSVSVSAVPALATSEESLLARARSGDPAALDHLVRRHLGQVERMLHRLLGPRRDMDDLVQNVFLELARSIHGFRGDSAFSTFLGGITVRVARRAMRPSAWQRRGTPLLEEPLVDDHRPDRATVSAERLRRAQALLTALPEAQRTAFVLWALEGYDPATIAEMTQSTVAATRSRIFYAQRRLEEGAAKDPWLAEWTRGGEDEPE